MSPRRAKTRLPVPLVPLMPVAPGTAHSAAEAVAEAEAAAVAEGEGHDPKRGQELLELEVKISV